MQKPPGIRRLAYDPVGASVLNHDRRDDEDLRGKRDQTGRCRFEDTHFNVLG